MDVKQNAGDMISITAGCPGFRGNPPPVYLWSEMFALSLSSANCSRLSYCGPIVVPARSTISNSLGGSPRVAHERGKRTIHQEPALCIVNHIVVDGAGCIRIDILRSSARKCIPSRERSEYLPAIQQPCSQSNLTLEAAAQDRKWYFR